MPGYLQKSSKSSKSKSSKSKSSKKAKKKKKKKQIQASHKYMRAEDVDVAEDNALFE